MRILWAGFLLGGLLLAAIDAYERRAAVDAGIEAGVTASEDGTPSPSPEPSPRQTRLR